ncbi:MAG: MBL fold metallo-hydrolase [Deltaproteobacteria bacterium]|nr:MBL fold metallo-hydrolase [Deltaproteobacteria bacterium]
MNITIEHFFDPATSTLTYLVYDPSTHDAIVIDPVLDFDPASGRTSTETVAKVEERIRARELKLHFSLETHAHADHLSGAQYLRRVFGAQVAIAAQIRAVQEAFKPIFDLPASFPTDGSQFDRLLADGETLRAGSLSIEVIATPGHTPACVSYKLGDAVFTGDALFVDDSGTGRADFPGGDARALYQSVHGRLYALPVETRVFVGHDYQPNGRALAVQTTIGSARRSNVQLSQETTLEGYVKRRADRDRTLGAPRLLLPSIQVNIDAGRLPKADKDGRRFLRLPLNHGTSTRDDGSVA